MTSSDHAISHVAIESFRGFRDRQEFDVAASAVLISGPNGTGKTSFFDAIQWALLGELERLEALRSRRSVEHIVNRYRSGERAVVELHMDIDGSSVRLRRSGDHKDSTLELQIDDAESVYGSDAEEELRSLFNLRRGMTLEMAMTTSGLMQQDVMRQILEAKPAERYAHLSSVLGLSQLEDFEDATDAAFKGAESLAARARAERDRALALRDQALTEREQTERRARSRPSIEILVTDVRELAKAAPPGVSIKLNNHTDSAESVSQFVVQLQSFSEMLARIAQEQREHESAQKRLPPPERIPDVKSLERALTNAEAKRKDAESAHRESQRVLDEVEAAAQSLARLAAAAIPLLSESCPVCGQAIDPDHVESELREQTSESSQILELRQQVEMAAAAIVDAVNECEKSTENLQDAKSLADAWRLHERQADQLKGMWLELGDLSADIAIRDASAIVENSEEVREFFDTLIERLIGVADAYAQGPDVVNLERLAAELNSLEAALEESESRFAEARERAARAQQLYEASKSARQQVAADRVVSVLPLVTDIYSRLDPHPAFKTVEFELDTYYRQGTTTPLVRDILEDVSADPLMVMSTSQANIMALSLFLAMGWVAGESALPFVLLDDPLQSMDDVNVLGFSDLFRHLRRKRQLLISTHEKRFASLLSRKLAPRNKEDRTIHYRFLGWDRSGPIHEREVIEPEMLGRPLVLVSKAG